MPKYQKYVNALFLGAAAIVWLISQHYVGVAIGYFQLARKIGGGTDFLQHGLPILFALVTFSLLRRNRHSHDFVSDSVGELTRVAWPTSREVRFGTIVVIITVILAGFILGLLDIGFTAFVKTLIGA